MLWFKFILGLMFFELVSILLPIVPDYNNGYKTKDNNKQSVFKNFAPKINLKHITYHKKVFLRAAFFGSQIIL